MLKHKHKCFMSRLCLKASSSTSKQALKMLPSLSTEVLAPCLAGGHGDSRSVRMNRIRNEQNVMNSEDNHADDYPISLYFRPYLPCTYTPAPRRPLPMVPPTKGGMSDRWMAWIAEEPPTSEKEEGQSDAEGVKPHPLTQRASEWDNCES